MRGPWTMFVAAAFAAALGACAVNPPAAQHEPLVERWGVFEAQFGGPSDGNPFLDVNLTATFTLNNQSLLVHGFYDGQGVYRIRFMPPAEGHWRYVTQSNCGVLDGIHGSLWCLPASDTDHGPVCVANTYHFAYADRTPFVLIGTTCYGWVHESQTAQEQTLTSLKHSPFNKVRMMLLPGKRDVKYFPYERDAAGNFDPMRFNPEFFHHLEDRIRQLGDQGVEADVILFNPYHKGAMEWFDKMNIAGDDRYLHYVVARLSAYRNVWWSLANEYNQVKNRTDADWDHFFQVVTGDDPYKHLCSIHNAAKFYDYNKPWVTHASVQNGSAVADFGRACLYRDLVRKPIVYDEICYEGDIDARWGRLSAQEMTKRFWLATIAGTYATHGETFSGKNQIAWTSGGSVLRGQSPARLAFLRKVLEDGPAQGIEPIDVYYHTRYAGEAGNYYLVYFGEEAPLSWTFSLPRDPPHKAALDAGMRFKVDILDTWNMTATPVDGDFTLGKLAENAYADVDGRGVTLPGKPYIALRIRRIP